MKDTAGQQCRSPFISMYFITNGLTDFFITTAYLSIFSLKEKDTGPEQYYILLISPEFSYLG